MTVQTRTLTVRVHGGDGQPLEGAEVTAQLDRPDYTPDGAVLPALASATADDQGVATLSLVPNTVGTQDSRYEIAIYNAQGLRLSRVTVQMPEADSDLGDLVSTSAVEPADITVLDLTWQGQQTFERAPFHTPIPATEDTRDAYTTDVSGGISPPAGALVSVDFPAVTDTDGATLDGDPLVDFDEQPLAPRRVDGPHVLRKLTDKWALVDPKNLVLRSDRTLHVDPDGDDSNSGIDPDFPKATIQSAWDFALLFDTRGFVTTVQLAHGTYDESIAINGPVPGAGFLALRGDPSAPRNVVIKGSSGLLSKDTFITRQATLNLRGLLLSANGAGDIAITAGIGSRVLLRESIVFDGVPATHMRAQNSGIVMGVTGGDYEIDGIGDRHLQAVDGGVFTTLGSIAATLNNSPTIGSEFALAERVSAMRMGGWSFTGAASGRRYRVATNAVMDTDGGGSDHFPGDSPGVEETGGIYV